MEGNCSRNFSHTVGSLDPFDVPHHGKPVTPQLVRLWLNPVVRVDPELGRSRTAHAAGQIAVVAETHVQVADRRRGNGAVGCRVRQKIRYAMPKMVVPARSGSNLPPACSAVKQHLQIGSHSPASILRRSSLSLGLLKISSSLSPP